MGFVEDWLMSIFPILGVFGYPLLFILTMFEAIPLLGFFSPGIVVVILAGFFAKAGALSIGWVIITAIMGAIVGDLIGYLLGKKYGYKLIEKYGKYFFFRKEEFELTKKLMESHFNKVMFIGKFNSLTRAFGPFVAGITDFDFKKFMFYYNIPSSIAFGTLYGLIGYIFGQSYEAVSKYIGNFFLILIIAFIGIMLFWNFVIRKIIFSNNNEKTKRKKSSARKAS